MRWLLSFWAASGIVLTSATQLRLAGPVGAGELLLVGWILFVVFLLLRGASVATGRLFSWMLGYWMISAVLMAFGTLVGLNTGRLDVANAGHDAVAFAFLAALSPMLSLALYDHEGNAYHESLARHIFIIFTVCSTSMLLISHFVSGLGPVKFWYGGGVRFLGWGENPNQIALFSVGMPFVAWLLAQRTRRTGHRILYGISIVCCVLVGLASASDGLKLSWLVGFGSAIGLAWWKAVLRTRGRFIYITHLLVPLVAIVVIVGLGPLIFTHAWDYAAAVYNQARGPQSQGEDRITLWTHALQALSYSPLVGFGPGAYSGHFGPFESFEAHGSLLDWANSTGLTGMILHIMLVVWCARQAWRAGSLVMFSMIIAVTVFGIFGYIFRQPIYWVLLILAARLPQQRSGAKVSVQTATSSPNHARAAVPAAAP